jgi:alcohol dehydrogenase class IV
MAIHPGSIEDYKRLREIPENGISLIAILKTSGTGNEVMLYTTLKRIGGR